MSKGQAPPPFPSTPPIGVPPGLEYLIPTNQIIMQVVQPETGIVLDHKKQYNMSDAWDRRIYTVFGSAKSSCCDCQPSETTYEVLDSKGNFVMIGHKTGGISRCGVSEIKVDVTCPHTGMSIGGISNSQGNWTILDGSGAPILIADPVPVNNERLSKNVFPLLSLNGEQVGMYYRIDGFNFQMEFPVDLDPQTKALALFAAFQLNL